MSYVSSGSFIACSVEPFQVRPILSPFSSCHVGCATVGVLKTSEAQSPLIALDNHWGTYVNWRVKQFQGARPSF